MGFNIVVPGSIFTKNIGSLIPGGDSLVGYWTFDGTLQDSIVNRVTGVAGTIVGTPSVSDGRIVTNKANGFITDLSVSGEKTFVVISKYSANAMLLGSLNYDAATTTNEGIAVFGGHPLIQLDSASKPTSSKSPDLTKIHFVAGCFGAASNSLFASSGGVITEEVASHTGNLNDAAFLRVGAWGPNNTSLVGTTETYAAMVFDRKLSSNETTNLFIYLKSIFPNIVID
ncbi:hypothetical protein OHV63_08845 [Acinetobacter baumannii]|uniref:hypothetical protein n=1 Tax=Acinetobacter baumannii TaxID=470 RepID=UPI000810AF68|nr:hypothetical protein [Acinetobacter baumannii]MCT9260442.1 hypothetical protein [Acinetobacter baumannii]MDC4612132.1 hypothetical protein [Acinetobacter baumannii]MDC5015839.1 hypothetical protein [Acinetobacter baumannii]MDV7568869.1 hypothetical protein [Acinetobacter baumannii]WFF52724.1 hypothetical protein OSV61_12890 [Acinetobacter baumannii]